MAGKVKPIPDGCHTVTPHLIVRGADKAIDFYKKAFGAKELSRCPGPNGKLMHAEIQIGNSHVYLGEEFPDMGCKSPQAYNGSPVTIHLYVEDVDASYKKAVAAGAQVTMPVSDMFWGDRYGKVKDPFGHEWSIATHKEDLTPKEMEKRMADAFAQMSCK